MVKFNKHHVASNGIKARVFYSMDNRCDGRKCVTIYAKDYGGELGKVIADAYRNDTDYQSDYIVQGTVDLFEGHPLYAAARERAEANKAARNA